MGAQDCRQQDSTHGGDPVHRMNAMDITNRDAHAIISGKETLLSIIEVVVFLCSSGWLVLAVAVMTSLRSSLGIHLPDSGGPPVMGVNVFVCSVLFLLHAPLVLTALFPCPASCLKSLIAHTQEWHLLGYKIAIAQLMLQTASVFLLLTTVLF